MKNKKFTYFVLLPAVITIWGLIVYRIVTKNDSFSLPEKYSGIPKKERSVVENKDYQLLNNYKDPFYQHLPQADETFNSDEQEINKPKKERKWPVIRLNGYILNGNKIKCHLTINGEDKILQVQENVLEDYIVSVITPDSIKISSQGDSRWFKR
jgi:hypothetical protein